MRGIGILPLKTLCTPRGTSDDPHPTTFFHCLTTGLKIMKICEICEEKSIEAWQDACGRCLRLQAHGVHRLFRHGVPLTCRLQPSVAAAIASLPVRLPPTLAASGGGPYTTPKVITKCLHPGIRVKSRCWFCEKVKKDRRDLAEGKRDNFKRMEKANRAKREAARRSEVKAPGKDHRRTPDSVMMEAQPGMVISKLNALQLGFGVYRTGSPCRHGHCGFRYVSTRRCVTCKRLASG